MHMKGQSLLHSAFMGENKGNGVIPVLYIGSGGREGQAYFYSVVLFGFFFIPEQIFNKLFILISIFDAFTITVLSSHQQPSLVVTS